MATMNLFDLLGDDANGDPSQLIAMQQQIASTKKSATVAAPLTPAKLPSKPLPLLRAVKETKSEVATAPSHGSGHNSTVYGRGGRGSRQNRNLESNRDASGFFGGYDGNGEDGEMTRPSGRGRGTYDRPCQVFCGGRHGGYRNGEVGGDSGRPPRRQFDRHSGTKLGNVTIKREGAGRGNWGTTTDEAFAQMQEPEEIANREDAILTPDKHPNQEDEPALDVNKEASAKGVEGEPEDKEKTLAEYEKILEEKRKGLNAMKTEERKVDFDKEFESMQLLSIKKDNDDIFIKLGSGKIQGERKKNVDRDERVKKYPSINEFLKPAEGERYYGPGGRGLFKGGFANGSGISAPAAPSVEDQGEFPSLG